MHRHSFTRYGLSGVVFTILGPAIFWLAYPMGAFLALGIAEATCHILRYFSFRFLVFPNSQGYRVSIPRYIISIVPTITAGAITVAIFKGVIGRTELTALGALISLIVGYAWSTFVYQQKISTRPTVEDASQH
jgi:putative flippase GtrA